MFGYGEATAKRGILTLAYPVQRGIIVNWDDIEKFLHHTFYNELRVAPEEHPTIFTEPALNPLANREKLTQILFETFNVPAFFLMPTAICALYAAGKTSGIVLESGHATRVVPIVSTGNSNSIMASKIWKSGVSREDVGGDEDKLLTERGFSFTTTAEKEILKDIKDSYCFISQDFKRDISYPEELFVEGYELPDGQVIRIGYERFRAPEMLFDPTLAGIDAAGFHKLTEKAGLAVPAPRRQADKLWENIVLAGGNTCFPGIGQRLQREVTQLLKESDPKAIPQVVAPPERPISAWVGASIMGSLSTMDQMWISKDLYDEHGPTIVHEKCNFYMDENSN